MIGEKEVVYEYRYPKITLFSVPVIITALVCGLISRNTHEFIKPVLITELECGLITRNTHEFIKNFDLRVSISADFDSGANSIANNTTVGDVRAGDIVINSEIESTQFKSNRDFLNDTTGPPSSNENSR